MIQNHLFPLNFEDREEKEEYNNMWESMILPASGMQRRTNLGWGKRRGNRFMRLELKMVAKIAQKALLKHIWEFFFFNG